MERAAVLKARLPVKFDFGVLELGETSAIRRLAEWVRPKLGLRGKERGQLKGTCHDQENFRQPPGEGPQALDVVLEQLGFQFNPQFGGDRRRRRTASPRLG